MSIPPLFYIVLSSYLLWRVLEKIGISYVLHCCGSWYYLLCHWEKTYTTIFTFLMANKVWEILIPQICIDFHNWENHTCTKKTTVNLFQTSNISKFYIKKTYRSAGSIEIKTCPIKAMSRSEFKFCRYLFWDILDVLFIWFCTGFGRHLKDFKKKCL